jgi:gas vesicle protein
MTNKKIVAGILTGVAAGITIALILNTKKGRETGKNLLKKGNRLTDDLKGKFGEFIDQVQGKVQGILK